MPIGRTHRHFSHLARRSASGLPPASRADSVGCREPFAGPRGWRAPPALRRVRGAGGAGSHSCGCGIRRLCSQCGGKRFGRKSCTPTIRMRWRWRRSRVPSIRSLRWCAIAASPTDRPGHCPTAGNTATSIAGSPSVQRLPKVCVRAWCGRAPNRTFSCRHRGPATAGDREYSDRLRSEFSIGAGSPVVGLVGALAPQKGHEALIAAAPSILAAVPDTVFLCVGEGRLRQRLQRQVRRRGIGDAFRFTGFRRDVPSLMGLCAVIAAPSLDGEGSSAVIKEAMMLGTPVVASDLPGNIEVLDGAGVAIPVSDADTLADAVVTMLQIRISALISVRLGVSNHVSSGIPAQWRPVSLLHTMASGNRSRWRRRPFERAGAAFCGSDHQGRRGVSRSCPGSAPMLRRNRGPRLGIHRPHPRNRSRARGELVREAI